MSEYDVVKLGPTVHVSAEMLDDSVNARSSLAEVWDRWANPWKYPDRRGWPERFTVSPLLARIADWWNR